MAVLSKIEQRLEKLRQETQKALAAKRQAEQALEQQKRVIVARVVLERCKTDDAFAETIRALLKETVTSDREKAAIADLLIRPVADTAVAPPPAAGEAGASSYAIPLRQGYGGQEAPAFAEATAGGSEDRAAAGTPAMVEQA